MRILLAAFLTISSIAIAKAENFTKLPAELDENCRYGLAKLYDECADQRAIFDQALQNARREGKTILVSYGAEWCIWCHVFDAYLSGTKTKFEYEFEDPDSPGDLYSATLYEREREDVSTLASSLNDYVRENFVLVHIEGQYAPNGDAVLQNTGAFEHYSGGIPFVFTVDHNGQFLQKINTSAIETRRDSFWDWYRGYKRVFLLEELRQARRKSTE
ncbi:DUF255 domain-containing protein [Roseibium sp.]|uniref:DUF255 domain-containing protein n=1 Tax=Roseibium sp. TaxID=1936156 RepID=UPI003BAE9265